MPDPLDRTQLRNLWQQALTEDGAANDITSRCSLEANTPGTAVLVAREPGIFAGRAILDLLAEDYATQLHVNIELADGAPLQRGTTIATLAGPLPTLLSLERTVLNFLQRLCGVATLTQRYVAATAGTHAQILDTRKTIPGWRQLDKYAVRCGGGHNHRTGLHDAILVKDNHLAGVSTAQLAARARHIVQRAHALDPRPEFIEFEVDSLEQFEQLLTVEGIDIILLDNFTPEQMRHAVARRDAAGLKPTLRLEASGGVNLDTVRAIAESGVERISIGALTHSARALDIAMDVTAGAD